ncbi:MAG: hypothetical protein JO126_00495 [Alphaproteobacteria bacterium]|nr:hypothetical protein [Alphaproteobacteria bacterium]MBV8547918.1 hypothetical protein [Alphaproteobacteria bacterium]
MSSWVEYFELGTLLAETAIAIVLAPEFIRHLAQRSEREARIALNIETIDPRKAKQPIFGLEPLSAQIGDVIDRARDPAAYANLDVGNEILIVGPEQSGKKALALHIGKLAAMRRAIIVYNPRDADVLARAKHMLERTRKPPGRYSAEKTLLILPGLDPAYGNKGEAWCDQLEALIETASNLPHVLIIGTVNAYERKGEVANWFGTILTLPAQGSAAWRSMIYAIADGFMDSALQEAPRCTLSGLDRTAFIGRVMQTDPTPAEVKDIFAQCETLATFRQRKGQTATNIITPDILDVAIERVVPRHGAT